MQDQTERDRLEPDGRPWFPDPVYPANATLWERKLRGGRTLVLPRDAVPRGRVVLKRLSLEPADVIDAVIDFDARLAIGKPISPLDRYYIYRPSSDGGNEVAVRWRGSIGIYDSDMSLIMRWCKQECWLQYWLDPGAAGKLRRCEGRYRAYPHADGGSVVEFYQRVEMPTIEPGSFREAIATSISSRRELQYLRAWGSLTRKYGRWPQPPAPAQRA